MLRRLRGEARADAPPVPSTVGDSASGDDGEPERDAARSSAVDGRLGGRVGRYEKVPKRPSSALAETDSSMPEHPFGADNAMAASRSLPALGRTASPSKVR